MQPLLGDSSCIASQKGWKCNNKKVEKKVEIFHLSCTIPTIMPSEQRSVNWVYNLFIFLYIQRWEMGHIMSNVKLHGLQLDEAPYPVWQKSSRNVSDNTSKEQDTVPVWTCNRKMKTYTTCCSRTISRCWGPRHLDDTHAITSKLESVRLSHTTLITVNEAPVFYRELSCKRIEKMCIEHLPTTPLNSHRWTSWSSSFRLHLAREAHPPSAPGYRLSPL